MHHRAQRHVQSDQHRQVFFVVLKGLEKRNKQCYYRKSFVTTIVVLFLNDLHVKTITNTRLLLLVLPR